MDCGASELTYPSPAHRIVAKLGGVKATADLAKGSTTSVYRWLQAQANGGGGGLVPLPAQRRMVRRAQERGIALDFAEFAPRDGEGVL